MGQTKQQEQGDGQDDVLHGAVDFACKTIARKQREKTPNTNPVKVFSISKKAGKMQIYPAGYATVGSIS